RPSCFICCFLSLSFFHFLGPLLSLLILLRPLPPLSLYWSSFVCHPPFTSLLILPTSYTHTHTHTHTHTLFLSYTHTPTHPTHILGTLFCSSSVKGFGDVTPFNISQPHFRTATPRARLDNA